MSSSISPIYSEKQVLSNGLRVQIATFNCNLQGTSSSIPDLTSWLIPFSPNSSKREPVDIYAIGFQELLPLNHGFSNSSEGIAAINRTDVEIRRTLRPHSALTLGEDGKYPVGGGVENYTLLGREHLVGMTIYVYGRERVAERDSKEGQAQGKGEKVPSLVERVKEVRIGKVGTGLLNLMGNKGAVGIRIVLKAKGKTGSNSTSDQVLTFVCAHLAAHDHQIQRRNQDWKNIVQRLIFDKDSAIDLPPVQINPLHGAKDGNSGSQDLKVLTEKYEKEVKVNNKGEKSKKSIKALDEESYSIYHTHHLFVFGDLNYRISSNKSPSLEENKSPRLTKQDIQRKINQKDYRTLLSHDQLNIERLSSPPRAFQNLNEFDLLKAGFGPTYKFKVVREGKELDKDGKKINGNQLSTKRIPGWTDRILFSGNVGETEADVKVELYTSVMKYTHSDHKPVTGIYELGTVGSSGLSLSDSLPYTADPYWRQKQLVGKILDRTLGYMWNFFISIGGGNLIFGILEMVVIAVISVWWLRFADNDNAEGREGENWGWMLGNLAGRP